MLSSHSLVLECYINEIIQNIFFCTCLLYSMSYLLDASKARVGKLWPCHIFLKIHFHRNIAMPPCWHDFPGSSGSNESTCSAGDPGLISESRRFPGKGNGNLLQYFCLENSMDKGAWYNPWGCKELDTTERLTQTQSLTCYLWLFLQSSITATETLWLTKSILFANTAFREKVCRFLTFIYDLMQFANILFQNFAPIFMKYIVLHFSFFVMPWSIFGIMIILASSNELGSTLAFSI